MIECTSRLVRSCGAPMSARQAGRHRFLGFRVQIIHFRIDQSLHQAIAVDTGFGGGPVVGGEGQEDVAVGQLVAGMRSKTALERTSR